MIIDEDIYLEHYGVLGMKWGVRKERRAAEKQAKRAKKAQKYLVEANVLQTKISELQNTNVSRYSFKGQRNQKKIYDLSVKRRTAIENAKAKSEGKLTQKQKNVLKGAAFTAAVVAAGVTYAAVQSGEATRVIAKGKDALKDDYDPGWKLDRSLSNPMTPDAIMTKVVSKVNPGYGKPGTKVNCRRATFAYEMRRRGYDVAATRTTNSHGQNVVGMHNVLEKGENLPTTRAGILTKVFTESRQTKLEPGKGYVKKGGPMTDLIKQAASMGDKEVEPSGIFKALAKEPNGARGELGMSWLAGGGHSMAWEIVGGKPVIFDTQSGIKYDSPKMLKELADNMAAAGYTRLDNRPLDTDFLMRWVKNA